MRSIINGLENCGEIDGIECLLKKICLLCRKSVTTSEMSTCVFLSQAFLMSAVLLLEQVSTHEIQITHLIGT